MTISTGTKFLLTALAVAAPAAECFLPQKSTNALGRTTRSNIGTSSKNSVYPRHNANDDLLTPQPSRNIGNLLVGSDASTIMDQFSSLKIAAEEVAAVAATSVDYSASQASEFSNYSLYGTLALVRITMTSRI